MHEFSVALEVCRMAEERLGLDGAARLQRVGLVVGSDSGLEPANLSFCLDALLAQPPFGGASCALLACEGDVLRVDYYEVDDGDSND
jgi:Zn finger protein HypA/HybF involved in hydrogenase expression